MNALKGGGKAFGQGFCGCLGAWVACLLLLIPLILILVKVAAPAIGGLLQGLPGIVASLTAPMGVGGPSGSPGPGTGAPPTPTGVLPRVEVWVTAENDPNAERLTTVKSGEMPEVVYLWAQGPEGASVYFQLWLTTPDGKRQQMGPNFVTDPTGKVVSCGSSAGPPPGSGTYKFEAFIGETVVGSTTVEVVSE